MRWWPWGDPVWSTAGVQSARGAVPYPSEGCVLRFGIFRVCRSGFVNEFQKTWKPLEGRDLRSEDASLSDKSRQQGPLPGLERPLCLSLYPRMPRGGASGLSPTHPPHPGGSVGG